MVMTGLLYKDFVAVHGKGIAAGLLLVTLALLTMPVWNRSEEGILTAAAIVICISLLLPLAVPLYLETAVFTADEGKKKKAWLGSLPVAPKQYIASKYLFVGIAYYVVLSVTAIWGSWMRSAVEQVFQEFPPMELFGLIPLYLCACLLLSALELPFLAIWGVRAVNALKQGILLLLFFLIVTYLLFGDLHVLDRYSIKGLVTWLQEHQGMAMALQTFSPVAAVLLFYLSYRVAGALSGRKEPEDAC
ncbi:MAG: ABC-2 transporter permease [Lachnospiraceae bacterium]|nr:ABC-2 transporter permease [Lachnospiraceae bacterium]